MRPFRSATLAALASIVLATPIAGCESVSEGQPAGEILIAADLELSGAGAQMGKAYQRALELKVEQVNASGALGALKVRLEVKDNRSDPTESLRNITDFTGNPKVYAIVMGGCSECAIGAAKIINDKRVPTVALAPATGVANPAAERRYLFKLAPNAVDNAAALVAELARQRIKKVGLLHTDDDYGDDGLTAMTGELDKAGIRLVKAVAVKPSDTGLSAAVSSLTSRKPDAIIAWTSAEQATAVARSAREAAYKGRLFFDANAAGELFMESGAGELTDGALMVFTETMVIDDTIATTPAKAARKQWFRQYTARFGGYYGSSSFAADAVQLIVDAVSKVDSGNEGIDRASVRNILETAQLDGLSGPIRMTPENHSGLMPQALTLLVGRGGRWRLAG